MTVQRGDKGVDFLYGLPSAASLKAKGIRFAALYLKRWSPAYVDTLHAEGIGVLPIVETIATMMLAGGPAGHDLATKAVADCQRFGIPEGVTIIFAHDTSSMTPGVIAFNVEAHKVIRAAGYGYGGYGGRGYFDQCRTAGVVFDLIWATNARGWLGGRHPEAHIWQGTYTVDTNEAVMYDTFDGVSVDKDVCQRTFEAWGSTPPLGDDMADLPCINNAEQLFDTAPHAGKFVVMNDGTVRHLTPDEWALRGSPVGTPWSNAQISAAGTYTPPVTTIPPAVPSVCNAPTSFNITGKATA